MWSGSSSSSSSGTDMSNIDPANMTSAQRDTVMESVKAQVALVQAQELIQVCSFVRLSLMFIVCLVQRLSDKCIRKCIQKPGTSLDKYDKVGGVLLGWLNEAAVECIAAMSELVRGSFRRDVVGCVADISAATAKRGGRRWHGRWLQLEKRSSTHSPWLEFFTSILCVLKSEFFVRLTMEIASYARESSQRSTYTAKTSWPDRGSLERCIQSSQGR